ncbi:MAG: hypothetical protein DRP63_00720 [Planctomycetota bacterium]|nr:MAG: hypothetical protein DRP63_00720 [Planctomycetota bacterium]
MLKRWRYSGLLTEAFSLFCRMLKTAWRMFEASKGLFGEVENEDEVLAELHKMEEETDSLHTEIRRKIVEYLSLVQGGDVIAALLLFSAVHDAERLADLAVNIAEAVRLVPSDGRGGQYFEEIKEVEKHLGRMVSLTVEAFSEQDEDAAKEALMLRAPIAAACNSLLSRIASDAAMSPARAVALTLLERYFKRTAAHLFHIAATVANPKMVIEHTKTPQPRSPNH